LKYLLTGGAGFIGSHLADAVTTRGDHVLVLDDLSTGRLENIEHLIEGDLAEFVEGSVLDAELVHECMSQVDACVHLASAVGVKLVVSNALETLRRNVLGSDTLLAAGVSLGKRVLFISTSEIYGKNSQGGVREDADRLVGNPSIARWGYGITKAWGEALAFAYHQEQGADTVVARLFNTVGPRQASQYGMVLPRFVRQAIVGEPLTVYGNGTQSRCFAHVLDTVHAISLLLDSDEARGRVFNVGSTTEMAIIELAGRVIERAGSDSMITLVPYAEAYDAGFEELGRRQPDTAAIRALTGWEPTRTVDEAIDDTIAFEQSQLELSEGLRLAG